MKILPILTGVAILAAAPLASAQKGGVAILDIDRAAQELNVDKAVLGELKSIEVDLNAQLNQIRNNLQTRMNQLESQASQQQRTQQLQQQLVAENKKLNLQFNQVKAQAQGKMAAERVKRINDFREKLKPIAEAAAKERGLDVVLTQSPQVFTFLEAVDITDDVIKNARAAGLEAEVPPAPPATLESGTTAPATSETGTTAPAATGPKPPATEAAPAKPATGKGKGN